MSEHTCHARNCTRAVPPKMFMCLKHWRMVPKPLQQAIWATYRPGQEQDKNPSEAYLHVARQAIDAVASWEARDNACEARRAYLMRETRRILRETLASFEETMAEAEEAMLSDDSMIAVWAHIRYDWAKDGAAAIRARLEAEDAHTH